MKSYASLGVFSGLLPFSSGFIPAFCLTKETEFCPLPRFRKSLLGGDGEFLILIAIFYFVGSPAWPPVLCVAAGY